MILKQEQVAQLQKKTPKYEMTCSLLNSWLYLFNTVPGVERDMEVAIDDFIDTLTHVYHEETPEQASGKEYEQSVYDGKDEVFSPIVKGGDFQTAIKKEVKIDGLDIVCYGKLDVLKASHIYDIKDTGSYHYLKFFGSTQHPMYFFLVPNAVDFTYLIHERKNGNHHKEKYFCDDNFEPITITIHRFLEWAKRTDYKGKSIYKIYLDNWEWDRKTHE